jgi:hypothetical protein
MPLKPARGHLPLGARHASGQSEQDIVEFANREAMRRAIAALIFGGVFERYPA